MDNTPINSISAQRRLTSVTPYVLALFISVFAFSCDEETTGELGPTPNSMLEGETDATEPTAESPQNTSIETDAGEKEEEVIEEVEIVRPNGATSLHASKGYFRADLSWGESSSEIKNYLLIGKKSSAPIWTPEDGVEYGLGPKEDIEIIYIGKSLDFAHISLIDGTTYHYSIYTYDEDIVYSSAMSQTNKVQKSGTSDPTFNGAPGFVATNFGYAASNQEVKSVAVKDGKYYAAGNSIGAATLSMPTVIRYNSDSTIDTDFGTSGVALQDVYVGDSAFLSKMIIDDDGSVYASGHINYLTIRFCTIYKTTPTGVTDTDYGNFPGRSNYVHTGGENCVYTDLKKQGNKIVAVGYSANLDAMILSRHTAAGILDTSFGVSGTGIDKIYLPNSINTAGTGVVIDSSGRILVAGTHKATGDTIKNMFVQRYTADGLLDSSFGNSGTFIYNSDVTTKSYDTTKIALQSSGRIIVSGYAADAATNNYNSVLLGLTPEGAGDSEFGDSGMVEIPWETNTDTNGLDGYFDFHIRSDDSILASGIWHYEGAANFLTTRAMICRLKSNGQPDLLFNQANTGITTLSHGSVNTGINTLTEDEDGNIFYGGYAVQAAKEWVIGRILQ
jgi:uncharacterized delta-60 repeat protein